jgi:hypothetical protein
MKQEFIEFPFVPITEKTFERQGWEKITETEDDEFGESETFTYYVLSLPKDNPDENCPFLISSADDEYQELGINKGEYFVEIADFFGLGLCTNEEELEILYRSLTHVNIDDRMSV